MGNSNAGAGIFHVSEAANLALHAMAVLAASDGQPVRTREVATGLKVSPTHLAKVMAMMERAGLVKGTRGPTGGYQLTRPASRISVAEVYEAVEGPLAGGRCVFDIPICDGTRCVLGGYFRRISREAAGKLRKTKLSEIALELQ